MFFFSFFFFSLLLQMFPDHKWLPWKFESKVGIWNDMDTQRGFMKYPEVFRIYLNILQFGLFILFIAFFLVLFLEFLLLLFSYFLFFILFVCFCFYSHTDI